MTLFCACWFCFCIHDLFFVCNLGSLGMAHSGLFWLLSSPQYLLVCFLLLTWCRLYVMTLYVMIFKWIPWILVTFLFILIIQCNFIYVLWRKIIIQFYNVWQVTWLDPFLQSLESCTSCIILPLLWDIASLVYWMEKGWIWRGEERLHSWWTSI